MNSLSLKQKLVMEADLDHKQYPQYKGHWDGDNWVVATARRRLKLHGVVVLEKGMKVLLDKNSMQVLTEKDTFKPSNIGKTFATVYLRTNMGGTNTCLPVDLFTL